MSVALISICCMCLHMGIGTNFQETARSFGLVIGTNVSRDPDVKALQFADDDAIQNAALLTSLGAKVVLLVDADTASQKLFPHVKSTLPTRKAVDAARNKLNALMDEAQENGFSTVFYFFYSGHGDIENNQGYVNLHDAKFFRKDILGFLKTVRSHKRHVIIDACKSYFSIFHRGAGGSRTHITLPLPDADAKLALPPNTGVFLSTSSAKDSHEWEAFQGGVFSHEMRSALRGAADLNHDGQLTYEETAAFIWTANENIANPKYRPQFFSKPPKDKDSGEAIFLDLPSSQTERLVIGPNTEEHLFLEDALGIRLADIKLEKGQMIELVLPTRRPLFVRFLESNVEATWSKPGGVHLAMLETKKVTGAKKGAEHIAFRKLFTKPFGKSVLRAFRNRPKEVFSDPMPEPDWTWARHSLGISGASLGLMGGILSMLALKENHAVTSKTTGAQRRRVNHRIDQWNAGAVVCYALSGTAILSYLAWTFWPEPDVQVQIVPSPQPLVGFSARF